MNFLEYLVFVLLLHSGSAKSSKSITQDIGIASEAIASIIDKMTDQYQMRFHIVTLSGDEISKEISDKVLAISPSIVSSEEVKNMTQITYIYGVSYILITKETAPSKAIKRRKLPVLPHIDRYYSFYGLSMLLNYAYDEELQSAKEQGKICQRNDFPFQPYRMFQLLNSKNKEKNITSLDLFNCVLFQRDKCEPEWKNVNTFTNFSKWKSEKFLVNYKNFNNCSVPYFMGIGDHGLVSFIDKYYRSDRMYLSGVMGDFFNIFSEKKDIVFNFTEQSISRDSVWWNYEVVSLFFSDYRFIPHTDQFLYSMELTFPVFYFTYTFMVTPGTRLTPTENLYMPFDWETWLTFVMTVVIGFLCIAIVKLFPKAIQDFVFGRNNAHPTLNMTKIFFGIGLMKIPTRNFARYLFMVFTLFCLIMRTAYQSKMFEFITGNLTHPTAKTFQDVLDMKLPIIPFANPYIFWNLENELIIDEHRRLKIMRSQLRFKNQTFAWWMGKLGKVPFENTVVQKLKETGMTIFKEDYDYEMDYILVKPESYIYEVFNEFILQWFEHGFDKFFASVHLRATPSYIKTKDPKVLTYHMLSAGFCLWLISVGIACIVFVIEHIVRNRSRTRHLVGESDVTTTYCDVVKSNVVKQGR